MSNAVKKIDMNVKKYLEGQMGFETLACSTGGRGVTYRMRHRVTGIDMVYELCGDGQLKFTIAGECRALPKVEDLQKQLPDTVTEQTVCRLVSQIVDRLLDNAQDETTVGIRKKFERHSKKLI